MKIQRRNKLAQFAQIPPSRVNSPRVDPKAEHFDVFELERGDAERIRATRCHQLCARYPTIRPNRQFDVPRPESDRWRGLLGERREVKVSGSVHFESRWRMLELRHVGSLLGKPGDRH